MLFPRKKKTITSICLLLVIVAAANCDTKNFTKGIISTAIGFVKIK